MYLLIYKEGNKKVQIFGDSWDDLGRKIPEKLKTREGVIESKDVIEPNCEQGEE